MIQLCALRNLAMAPPDAVPTTPSPWSDHAQSPLPARPTPVVCPEAASWAGAPHRRLWSTHWHDGVRPRRRQLADAPRLAPHRRPLSL